MLLFSEIKNPHNDSFYLKFRKDYDLEDFENIKLAIESISRNYLNLQIKHDDSGDFKHCSSYKHNSKYRYYFAIC